MTEYVLVFLLVLVAGVAVFLAFERYLRRTGTREEPAYVSALKDLLDGKPESAFALLRQAVAEDSSNIDAYLRLGQILRAHNQPRRALEVHKGLTLRKGLPRDDKLGILHELALDYQALDDHATAESALREMIAIDSGHRWAHVQLARLLERSQRWDEAYDTAAAVIKLEGNKSKVPLARYKAQMADQLGKKREYHKARVVYKEALGLDPHLADVYLAIGDSYREEGRLEDAVVFWKKLITAVPEKGHLVIDRLEKTLFDMGRYGDIMDVCQQILEHAPKNLEARLTLARFYDKKGDLEASAEILDQVVDDYPDSLPAVLGLINIYLERNEHKKLGGLIRTLLRKAESAEPVRKASTGARHETSRA